MNRTILILIIFINIIIVGIGLYLIFKKPSQKSQSTKKPSQKPVTFGSTSSKSSSGITPLDGNGNPVDWFFCLKFPEGMGCDCKSASCTHWDDKKSKGLCYLYADSNNPIVRLNSDIGYGCLNETNNPVTQTLQQLTSDASYVIWNDQGKLTSQNGSYKDCGAPHAHSKGAAGIISNTGFIMNCSTPYFPDPDNFLLGCQDDDNAELSQHFFCFSVGSSDFSKWASTVANAKLCTLVTNKWDNYTDVTSGGKSSTVSLKTLNGIDINMMVKGSEDFFIPWTFVADTVGEDLSVLSFYGSPYTPPVCAGAKDAKCTYNDTPKQSITIVNSLGYKSYSWCGHGGPQNTSNHAKIAIGSSPSDLVICGSMNMQGTPATGCKSSQMGRGGDFYAIHNKTLWSGLDGVFQGTCSCSDSTATCAKCSV
jgi:hypothetical protein